MDRRITTIAFDADDTLWQNETFYRLTQERFAALLARHVEKDRLHERLPGGRAPQPRPLWIRHQGLHAVDDRDRHRGDGRTRARRRHRRDHRSRSGRCSPIRSSFWTMHARRWRLWRPITVSCWSRKAIFSIRERKLAQSGLGDMFHAVEIVSDKNARVYDRIFRRHGDGPERALMVGNSLKSDVLPPIEGRGDSACMSRMASPGRWNMPIRRTGIRASSPCPTCPACRRWSRGLTRISHNLRFLRIRAPDLPQ